MEICLDLEAEGEDVGDVLNSQFVGDFMPRLGPAPEIMMFS